MERRIALSVLCDLNNGAVDLLATGRCDLAQIVFAEAIQATTKLMRKETNEQTEGCALDSSDNAETLPNSAQLFQSSVLNICHDETLSDGGHEQSLAASEDGGFVYRRAFKLRYDHYMPQFETICIIILYNMGIGCHIHGTQSCSHQALTLAASYYGLALSACGGDKEGIMHAVPPTLRLAILNNMGEIYFRLSQHAHMVMVNDDIQKSWCGARIGVLVGEDHS